jgi:pimeloyl-ACP methyl ester carboxylesterase
MTSTDLGSKLADASTITVVVHGVGDHNPTRILEEVALGLSRTMADRAQDYVLTSVDASSILPAGTTGISLSGVEITTGGKTHLLLALVWSSMCARFTDVVPPLNARPVLQALKGGDLPVLWGICWGSALALWSTVLAAAILIIKMDFSIAPLLLRRSRKSWRVGVMAAVLLVSAALLAWILVAFTAALLGTLVWVAAVEVATKVYAHEWQSLLDPPLRDFSSEFFPGSITWWWVQDWTHWVYLCLLVVGWGWMAWRSMPVVDLTADVVIYVTNDEIRISLLNAVQHVIDQALGAKADSKVIVVGHSLGSVVVTHALAARQLRRSVTLVTLGSPLPLMSRVFENISSPAHLLRGYRASGSVDCWVHAFRDADVIGRSLSLGVEEGFIECGLGRGPHWNYFSDARLWKRMIAVVGSRAKDDHAVLRAMFSEWEIDDGERRELMGWRILLGLLLVLIPLEVMTQTAMSRFLLVQHAPQLLGGTWKLVSALLLATKITAYASGLTEIVAFLAFLRATGPRKKLQVARLWCVGVLCGPMIQTVTTSAALALLLVGLR